MRILFTSILAALALSISFGPLPSVHAGSASPSANSSEKVLYPGCSLDLSRSGVLIEGVVKEGGFQCYLYTFLRQNMPYVIILAIVLVVFSGVEYMYAMGNPSNQAKAKARILGIIGGLLFYFLIQYGTRLASSSIRIGG